MGPAKRSKRSALLKEVDSSGTDHWKGGTVFDSGDDPDDQDLTAFLEANASFLYQMTQTAAFTDTCPYFNTGFLLFCVCLHAMV